MTHLSFSSQYDNLAQVVIRTPLLTQHRDVSSDLQPHTTQDGTEWERLRSDPLFMEGVALASMQLYDRLQSSPGTVSSKAIAAALRYGKRARTRATPFGLFAGVSLGSVASHTEFEKSPRGTFRRQVRLDLGYAAALISQVLTAEALLRRMRFALNDTLYVIAGRAHYIEPRSQPDGVVFYDRSSIAADEGLLRMMTLGTTPHSFTDWVNSLADLADSPEDAERFVFDAVEARVLLPQLSIGAVGSDPLASLWDAVDAGVLAGDVGAHLRAIKTLLATAHWTATTDWVALYRDVHSRLEQCVSTRLDLPPVQVDLWQPMRRATLSQELADLIRDGAGLLFRLTPPIDPLRDWAAAFAMRYEQQFVPFLEALDEDAGLGLAGELSGTSHTDPSLRKALDERQLHLVELLMAAAKRGEHMISLSDASIERLSFSGARALPESFAVLASIHPGPSGDADGSDALIELLTVTPGSAAALIGRFTNLHAELGNLARQIAQHEALLHTDALDCEIVHVPQGRLSNVICRAPIRQYELPLLSMSTAATEQQIALGDLVVGVRSGRIVLYSRTHQREILPRLASMQNFSGPSNLQMYRFLCLLEMHHAIPILPWSWRGVSKLSFRPRVQFGRLVLARASWTVRRGELSEFMSPQGALSTTAFADWRLRRGLPRQVLHAEADNRLPLDLARDDDQLQLVRALQHDPIITLVEDLDALGRGAVRGEHGRFGCEVVVPYVRRSSETTRVQGQLLKRLTSQSFPNRRLAPKAEHGYLKMYTGAALLDRVLLKELAPTLMQLTSNGTVEKWFFVRYVDPEPHLRLRYWARRPDATAVLSALQDCASAALDRGLLWRVQMDTYVREVERYGGAQAIELAEDIFAADSEACVAALTAGIRADRREDIATRSAMGIFRSFFPIRSELMEVLLQATSAHDKAKRIEWGEYYRHSRKALESCLGESSSAAPADHWTCAYAIRDGHVAASIASIRRLAHEGSLCVPLEQIVLSLTHMTFNRIMDSIDVSSVEPRAYDIIRRVLLSEASRERGSA